MPPKSVKYVQRPSRQLKVGDMALRATYCYQVEGVYPTESPTGSKTDAYIVELSNGQCLYCTADYAWTVRA